MVKYGTTPSIVVKVATSSGGMTYAELRSDYLIVDEHGHHINLPYHYQGVSTIYYHYL